MSGQWRTSRRMNVGGEYRPRVRPEGRSRKSGGRLIVTTTYDIRLVRPCWHPALRERDGEKVSLRTPDDAGRN